MREKKDFKGEPLFKKRWIWLFCFLGALLFIWMAIYRGKPVTHQTKADQPKVEVVEKFQTWLKNPSEGVLFKELEHALPARSDHRACLYLYQAQQASVQQGDLKRMHEWLLQAEQAVIDPGLSGLVAIRLIRVERGLGLLEPALNRAQQLSTPGYEGWAILLQALIQEDRGDLSSARELYKRAIFQKSLTPYLQEFCEMKLASMRIQPEAKPDAPVSTGQAPIEK